MKTMSYIVAAAAAGIALVGCSKPAPPSAAPKDTLTPDSRAALSSPGGRAFYGGGVFALKEKCKDVGIPEDASGDLKYTIKIGSNFQLRSPAHQKLGNKPKKPKDHGNGHKTLLDLGTEVAPGKPATIEIDLRGSGLKLMPDDVVLRGDENMSHMVCDVTTYGSERITFRTYQIKDSMYTWGNYNLGVVAQGSGGYELPIYIDPILDNDGYGDACTDCK